MLKRRASKRFVLAETGEPVAWDTTADNDRAQGGYRRDSDAMPAGPSLVFTTSSESLGSEVSTSPDVANNANLNSAIVDGSRLAVGTSTTLNTGGSLK